MTSYSWVFWPVLLLVIAGGGGYAFHTVRKKVRHVSKELFGTQDLLEGIRSQEEEYANTPKSVASMTNLYLPRISRDFPDFNYPQFVQRSQNLLQAVFLALSTQDLQYLKEGDQALQEQARLRIDADRTAGIVHHFEKPHIYQTEITRYEKKAGLCIITLQHAVGYYAYITEPDGTMKSGSKDVPKQTRYNTELVYVQDFDRTKEDTAFGTLCPICGAPVKNLGRKHCEYCGAAIAEIQQKVWKIHRYQEVAR